jgi:DNA-binding MarR family transcriptional regulator
MSNIDYLKLKIKDELTLVELGFFALLVQLESENLSQQELAERLYMSDHAVSRNLFSLERGGLIKRDTKRHINGKWQAKTYKIVLR